MSRAEAFVPGSRGCRHQPERDGEDLARRFGFEDAKAGTQSTEEDRMKRQRQRRRRRMCIDHKVTTSV